MAAPCVHARNRETLAKLQANRQVLWQYCDAAGALTDDANPNGSLLNIAGIANDRFNVAGLMPHPDRASETVLGSDDGRYIFASMITALEQRSVAKAA
jgi:phosphoribosylformylglycinamidine (FGAM) synthase-like amidotransferase family enzyme